MSVETKDLLQIFQFNDQWLALGIVTPEILDRLWQEYAKGQDLHTEHYRWRVFQKFLDNCKEIDAYTINELYELSEKDPDISLKESMLHALIKRADCPSDILEKVVRSTNQSLVKLALKQIEKRKRPQV